MKKIILTMIILTIVIFTIGIYAYAQEIDINPEPRPSVTKITVDTIRILRYTKTCEITLRYLDADEGIVRERTLIYMDVEDNPETPEDETSTEYTQLINGLGIDKTFLKKAIKYKLGIE